MKSAGVTAPGASAAIVEDADAEVREARFWDGYAEAVDIGLADLANLDPYARARLRLLGDLSGRQVLDLGCGVGHATALLALLGARVTAIDISPLSVEQTRRRAEVNGVADRVDARVMSAYRLDFPAAAFDLVHGQDILHHLDVEIVGREVHRVLRPGGRAVFQENNANNPVLMLARRLCGHFGIPKWSSDDEYPLGRARIAQLAGIFGGTCETHYPALLLFGLLDMKLFGYRNRLINRLCARMDKVAHKHVPALRPYGYKQIIVLSRRPG